MQGCTLHDNTIFSVSIYIGARNEQIHLLLRAHSKHSLKKMDAFTLVMKLLILFYIFTGLNGNLISSSPEVKHRSSRKYDAFYEPQNSYGDDGSDETHKIEDDSRDTDSNVSRYPPTEQVPDVYPNSKFYNYGQKYASFNKGYTFVPYWKGSQKDIAENGEMDYHENVPSMYPYKMMEMLMTMDAMDKLQESTQKNDNSGFLSKFVSDTKSFVMAAIVPLSIMLAAIIPVLVNYTMTGVSLPLVSAVANNKNGRNADTSNILDEILWNFEEITRSVDTDSCIQKTLCEVAFRNSSSPGAQYIRKSAVVLSHLIKQEWIKSDSMKSLMNALKQGNCNDVCENLVLNPRVNNQTQKRH